MKKKFVQILTLLVVAVSVGAFVSCKDTNEDMYNDLQTQMQTQNTNLSAENANLKAALQEWINKLQDQITKYQVLETKLTALEGTTSGNTSDISSNTAAITQNAADIATNTNKIENLTLLITAQGETITDLLNRLTALENNTGDPTAIAALTALINGLKEQIENNEKTLAALTNVSGPIAEQAALIATLQAQIKTLEDWKETVKSCECDKYTEVLETLAALQQAMVDAKDKVDAAIARAQGTADAAQATANDAKTAAASAQTMAENAATAAQNAVDYAKTVEDKAVQAGMTAAEAKQAAEDAWALATEALVAANTANALASQVTTLAAAVATNTADIATIKSAITALQTETAAIRTLISDNKTEILDKITDVINRISADETTFNTKIAENAQNIVKNSEDIAKNAENIEKNAQDIVKANQDIATLSGQIKALEDKTVLMDAAIQAAFDKASAAAADAQANSVEIAAMKAIIQALQADVTALKGSSGGTNPATDAAIQTLQETTQNLQNAVSQLTQTLNDKISELTTQLGDQATTNSAAIAQLQQALADLQEATGKTETTVNDLTTRVNDLLDRLSALEATVTALQATCNANLEVAKLYADQAIETAKLAIMNEVKELLKEYLKSGDIDLTKYVTKEEVADYISKSELDNYAKKEDLANLVDQSVIDQITARLDAMMPKTEIEAAIAVAISNLYNDILDNYITGMLQRIRANEVDIEWLKNLYNAINTKVDSQGNTLGDLVNWQSQIDTWQTMIQDKLSEIEGGTSTTIIERITEIREEIKETILQDINTTLATTVEDLVNDELTSNLGTILDTYNFVTEDQIEGLAQALLDLAELKTKLSNLQDQVDNLPDYGTRVTTLEEQIAALQNATSGLAQLIADVNTLKSIDFSNFATKGDLNNLATKDDLNNYALASELTQYIKTSDLLVLLSQYAGKDEFDTFKQNVLDALAGKASQEDITAINTKIDQLEDALNNLDLSDYATKQEVTTQLTNLKSQIDSELAEALQNYVTNTDLNTYLAEYAKTSDLANYVTNTQLDSKLSGYVTNSQLVEELQGYATVGALATLSEEIDNKLKDYVTVNVFNSAKQELLDKIDTNTAAISDINTTLTTITSSIETMQTDIQDLQTRVGAAETLLEQIQQKYDDAIDELKTDIATIQNNLAKQVTSIMIQGTNNPWFGTFNLPFDVQSNVLIAFYGVPMSEVEFPTSSTANYVRANEALTDEDLEMLGLLDETLLMQPAGKTLMYENGYAGKIYMTINPNTADVTGLQPKIVNSLDEESLISLTPIQPSTEKLQFGFTRAGQSSNGFYEANAIVTPDKVKQVNGPTLETGAMADAIANARDAIEQIARTQSMSGSGAKLENIASDINKIVNGLRFDRSGLKCSYTTQEADGTEKEHSVYSQYNLAATAFKPLSLETAKDFHYVTIPGYEQANSLLDRLSNTVRDRVHTFFKDINSNGLVEKIVNLQIKDINVPDLSDDLLAKFELHMDTVFIMGGLEYHFQMPIDVEVPVKFDKNLTIPVQINGINVTVPVHVEQDVAVDLTGVTVTSPTVVVTGTATGTANAGAVLDPETGLPVFDGDGNIELVTVLRVPVCDNDGNIVGYTDVPLDDIHVSANISASGTVGDGEITLDGSPIAHVVIDDEFSTTINIDENVSYHLVIEDTFTKHIDISKYIQLGYVDYLRDPNEQDGYAKDENGNLIPLKDENGNPIPGDKRGFILRFNYDMRDAASELWDMAAGALTDVNKMMADLRDIVDEVNNLVDKVNSYESKITDTVDNYIDKIRSYIDKINTISIKLVNNTNQLFQPFMVASTSKGTKRLSGSKNYPTVLSKDVTLFATTQTMELFVPLAKKHIAVTNVFKDAASAQKNNGECKQRLKEANTGKFNTLLDGTERLIKVNNLQPGYVYEIAYSVLDFHGKMATRKYYITVQ